MEKKKASTKETKNIDVKVNKENINTHKLNELISLSNLVVRILIIFLIVTGVYAGIVILKEIKVLSFLFNILKIISPLFVGLIIAWLFDPIVTYLSKKGIKRVFGSLICYVVILGILIISVSSLIPVLYDQINDFVTTTVPSLYEGLKNWMNDFFMNFKEVDGFDVNSIKADLFSKLENYASNLTSTLPTLIVNVAKSLFSGLGSFAVGLVIGFFLLLNMDDHIETLYSLIPNKYREETKKLLSALNKPLKKFVQGSLLDCTVIFIINAIGFSIIGLKAPLLFALFCAITNIIPYVGPYIGGIPAVVIGFTQSTSVGIIVLIFIMIVQALEGNLLQPLIMSKTTKLSPIVIILGLIVFEHFFGIWGMVLSTPILGALKELIAYFDKKYNFFDFKNVE
ncbi:MAG: AI-2E family transporter [Firmicutes bacterium]|nr:AI-2E family transporter [Bacillota bacterium]